LSQIKDLDAKADLSGLDEEDWAFRYHLEDELLNILCAEDEYWRQRGRQNWILQGDANTTYFHAIANGRRRKCAIRSLISEEGEIFGQQAIQEHIYKFYLELMGSEEPKFLKLASNCWAEEGRVSREDNDALALSFTMEELEEVIKNTKTATAPGPDGLPVAFLKNFWPLLKDLVFRILNGFALGTLDISRLNFGILSLIPKVLGADSIKQFRPIALINVIFKFVSKAVANRLSQWLIR
jgi:mannosylglycoprotein endo-beta-mannosidase